MHCIILGEEQKYVDGKMWYDDMDLDEPKRNAETKYLNEIRLKPKKEYYLMTC